MRSKYLNGLPRWPTIALVGCGAMAERFYLPALRSYPPVFQRLILVDKVYDRAKRVGERFALRNYLADYREILHAVDGVILAVPHHLHFPIGRECLSSRVHVLCEKPLAETGAEAAELVSVAAKHGVTLSVNNTRRLFPSSGVVKQLIDSGAIGNILSISYYEGGEFTWPTTSGFYFNSKVSQKGVLLDIGAHVFDVICWWLGGKPRVVSSENDSFGGCEAAASVRFEYGNCRGEVRLSRLGKLPNYFLIRGEKGAIKGDVYDIKGVSVSSIASGGKETRFQVSVDGSDEIARRLVSNFLQVLTGTGQPLIPASEVVASIQFIDEAYSEVQRFRMPWYEQLEGAIP